MANPTEYRQSYQSHPVSTSAAAPKEIGVIQRLEGIRSGVNEIEYQLRAFIAALHGNSPTPEATAGVHPPGITGTLSGTEASIRETMGMLKQLADAF